MKCVLNLWIPVHEALLEMIIYHLPSPVVAQEYRVENLYQGPLEDRYATAIRKCDAKGPMVMYVSKMCPGHDKNHFCAFGRVFSGKITSGHKVRIMAANYEYGEKKDLYTKSVQQ